jgi:Xaa-Pro dipeptidase
MQNSTNRIVGLTMQGCQARRQRLTERLASAGLDAALICDRRHVYYLSGYWAAWYHTPLMVQAADGASHLVLPDTADAEGATADKASHYQTHKLGTLADDQFGAALRPLESDFVKFGRWGIDLPHLVLTRLQAMADLSAVMLSMRRAKDEDEVALIQHAVRACEAAYARAREILRPGIREIDVYAEVQAAAVREAGEPIGELGNDFQAGTPGGPPRTRPIDEGELMPLDVAVSVRGYRCDLCRTFAVGGEPTGKQQKAAQLVRSALEVVEAKAQVGHSCRELYEEVHRLLEDVNGWQFPHHLGHGTGLSPHEAPRFNPFWNDVLEVGDLFTVEPGLYHAALRGGVRIEQNYWLSPNGLCRLSSYPTDL